MAKDPTTVAKRWAERLGGSMAKITEGVQAVTTSPTAKAAAQDAKYLQNVQAAIPKWKSRLQAVSLSDWQTAMVNKGIPRISTGATNAVPKMTNFMSQFLPFIESQAATVRAMPSLTLQDNVNRAVAMINAAAKFSYKK